MNSCKWASAQINLTPSFFTLYNLNYMGAKDSKSVEILKFIEREWEYLKTNKIGNKIYRNRFTDHEAQLQTIGISQKINLQKQYDIYNYRRTQDNALVCVYAVQNLKDTAPNLCGNRSVLKVMVQSIPWRLSDFPKLNFRQSIYVLSEAIRGYDDCYSKIGQFEINAQMIGLNNMGKLKVWLTQFLGQNHPSDQKPILQITTANQLRSRAFEQQHSMVKQVISLVQKKCKQKFPVQLRLQLNNQSTFADAYQCIEQYCVCNQLQIPDRIILEDIDLEQQYKAVHNSQIQPNNDERSNFSFRNTVGRGTHIKELSFQNNISSLQSNPRTRIRNPNIRTHSGSFDPLYRTEQPNNSLVQLQYKEKDHFQPNRLGLESFIKNSSQASLRPEGLHSSYPQNNMVSFSRQGYYSRGFSEF